MTLPNTYTDKNETGCCPIPNVEAWDKQEVKFENKKFIRMYTKSFFYIPLNMSKVMTELFKTVESAGASLPVGEAMILSHEISLWKAEQLYAVSKTIEGADNVELNGTYLTRVFEGPYSEAKNWFNEMYSFAKEKDKVVKNVYFFYTTCPKCAKHYGKNYVIGFAEVE